MKYLAIDYGQKRTGLAVSDPEGRMAFPRITLTMRGKDAFFADLFAQAEADGIQAFVVGLPLRTNNEDSETTRQVRNMAARLMRRTDLPVYFMPETLSSHEAEERLRDAGRKRASRQAVLDQAAAVAILESFLALPQERRTLAGTR